MKMFLIYHVSSGEVISAEIRQEASAQLKVANLSGYAYKSYSFIDHTLPQNYYFPSGVKTARPKMTLTHDKTTVRVRDLVTITGIPTGTKVTTVDIFDQVINDGELQLRFNSPGTYKISFNKFPYKIKELVYYVS